MPAGIYNGRAKGENRQTVGLVFISASCSLKVVCNKPSDQWVLLNLTHWGFYLSVSQCDNTAVDFTLCCAVKTHSTSVHQHGHVVETSAPLGCPARREQEALVIS